MYMKIHVKGLKQIHLLVVNYMQIEQKNGLNDMLVSIIFQSFLQKRNWQAASHSKV